jgi:hypothetical protein
MAWWTSNVPRRTIYTVLLLGFILTAYQLAELTNPKSPIQLRKLVHSIEHIPWRPSPPTEHPTILEQPVDPPIEADIEPHINYIPNAPVGRHFNITAVPPTLTSQAVPTCSYPIAFLVTPDKHCSGALGLYSSIIRNVLIQPEHLRNKTCVHVMYVDHNITSIEEMYRWHQKPNPYTAVEDCAALSNPVLNDIVPLHFHAIAPIVKPPLLSKGLLENWKVAFDKVNLWGFDVYPRVLFIDIDVVMITDLHLVFEESNPWATVAVSPDQFANCMDRARLNSGFMLLRPSRYFHVVALELLHDPEASCLTGDWAQGDQEVIGCMVSIFYFLNVGAFFKRRDLLPLAQAMASSREISHCFQYSKVEMNATD